VSAPSSGAVQPVGVDPWVPGAEKPPFVMDPPDGEADETSRALPNLAAPKSPSNRSALPFATIFLTSSPHPPKKSIRGT
jgi:hypothetical protein